MPRTRIDRFAQIRRGRRIVRRASCLRNKRFILIQVFEFAECDLLTDDIDIERKEHLLNGFDHEPGGEAYRDCHQKNDPERQCPVRLSSTFIELGRGLERRIDSSPEEDKQTTDGIDQYRQPVPPITVDKDIGVAGNDGTRGDKYTHSVPVANVFSTRVHEVCWLIQLIWHKEAYDGLVKPVKHMQPASLSLMA